MDSKIRVLIVDDSSLMREALKNIIETDGSIEVIGMASNGKEGVEKAVALKPDVVTMDLKMPLMDGLEAIEKIMEEQPVPIIVVSTIDTNVIIKALGIGAMDFVAVGQDIDVISKELLDKIKIASRVKPLRRMAIRPVSARKPVRVKGKFKIVAIGVSTGGPQALQTLLASLPRDLSVGMLVVQHISKGFLDGLVSWLKPYSSFEIKIAKAGDVLKPGMIMFAPDSYNMEIDDSAKIYLKEEPSQLMLHIPSIDVMMKSVAENYGEDAIGVIMTGMGSDGVEGMKAIKKAGGKTIAQDEKTSVIFGMNKLAIDSGCVDKVLPLGEIPAELLNMTS